MDQGTGQTEVDNFRSSVGSHQDVGWFQVAVQAAISVEARDPFGYRQS